MINYLIFISLVLILGILIYLLFNIKNGESISKGGNENIQSKCGWSPFNGYEFKGTPVSTIIAGKIKMRDGKILGDPDGTPIEFN